MSRLKTRIWTSAFVVIAAVADGGCGIGDGHRPSPLPPPTPGGLSVSMFSSLGWHVSGEFHYRPAILLTAAGDGSAVIVWSVRLEGSGDGAAVRSAGISYPNGRRLGPAGVLELRVPSFELVTTFRVITLRLIVEFTDGTGRAGSAVAQAPAPEVSTESPAGILSVTRFEVLGSGNGGGTFFYWPKLTLEETTGLDDIRIVKMVFELLDVGADGRVPPVQGPILVPAGGTTVLDEDPLGYGPWMEISSHRNAQRVSVFIHYVDTQGRGGSTTAMAEVR